MGSHHYEFQLSMGTLTTISRYVNSAFRAAGRAAGLAAVVALSGCSNGSSTPPSPQGGTLEEKGINLTPDSSEVVTEMDEGGEEISYAKDKVLVQVAAGTKAADLESLLQQVQGQVTGHIQPLNWYEIQVPDAKTALPEILQHPLVQNAELNYAGAAEELDIDAPGISGFAEGYHKIKLSEAYGFIGDKNLANVTVAVLDSSFDLDHPELASQFLPGVDVGSVDNNPTYEDASENLAKARTHGTSVAGIIAMLNNGKDLNGVAYNAKILPVKVSASTPLGKAIEGAAPNAVFAFKVAAGITYAALEGADVINMSLGWHSSSPSWLLQSAVEYAQAEGVSLVASAGNENKDGTNHYPSVLNGVISVGATTEDDKRWTYSESTGSNYSVGNNSKVLTVAAPGEDIWSAAAGERGELAITPGTGTSLAAPFVSGLDALVKSLKPSLSAEERRQIIIDSADEIKVAYPELDYPNVQGNKTWKRINAYNAVVLAETGCNPAEQDCDGDDRCEGLAPGAYEEWTVVSSGSGLRAGTDIAVDSLGNSYIIGFEFVPEKEEEEGNILIDKYDSAGNRSWSNPIIYNDPANNGDEGVGIILDSEENIYATGTIQEGPSRKESVWINKYDSNGNELWPNPVIYDSPAIGGTNGKGIAVDSVGNIYVTGLEKVQGSDLWYNWNIWINKYDASGNPIWNNPITYDSATNSNDSGSDVIVDSSNNIYVVGYEGREGYNPMLWLNKYNGNGNPLWPNPVTVTGSDSMGNGVALDSFGDIYVVGSKYISTEKENVWINKYDPNGTPLWPNPILHNGPANDDDAASDIAVDSAGNIYVIGHERILENDHQIWVNKYDSNGNALWLNHLTYNSSPSSVELDSDDIGTGIALDQDGNIYAVGTLTEFNIWLRKYFQCD